MVSLFPLFAHMAEDALPLGASFPVRYDLLLVAVDVLLRDAVRLQVASIERVQVFYCVACQFGEGRHCLRHRASLTHYQFVLADVYGLLLAYLVEVARAQNAVRHLAVVLLVECRLNECALNSQRRFSLHALLVQAFDTFVHASLILWIFQRIVHFAVGGTHGDSFSHNISVCLC